MVIQGSAVCFGEAQAGGRHGGCGQKGFGVFGYESRDVGFLR